MTYKLQYDKERKFMNTSSLDQLRISEFGLVKDISPDSKMRRRLQDIGIIKGTKVQCLQKSLFGDPIAYLIRGAVIAIRKEDAQDILVETIPES